MAPSLRAALISLDDAGRVLPAPHDLAAGPGAEAAEHVGELVRPGLQLGVRARPHVAASTVVDHGDLSGWVAAYVVSRSAIGHSYHHHGVRFGPEKFFRNFLQGSRASLVLSFEHANRA